METKVRVIVSGREYEVEFIDVDFDGDLYLAYNTTMYVPTHVIRAREWFDADEALLDALTPITEDEILDAYGYDGWDSGGVRTEEVYSPETAQARFDADVAAAQRGEREYPDLMEGYRYQPNATGTGIVYVEEMRLDILDDDIISNEITITINIS